MHFLHLPALRSNQQEYGLILTAVTYDAIADKQSESHFAR